MSITGLTPEQLAQAMAAYKQRGGRNAKSGDVHELSGDMPQFGGNMPSMPGMNQGSMGNGGWVEPGGITGRGSRENLPQDAPNSIFRDPGPNRGAPFEQIEFDRSQGMPMPNPPVPNPSGVPLEEQLNKPRTQGNNLGVDQDASTGLESAMSGRGPAFQAWANQFNKRQPGRIDPNPMLPGGR